jgi:hypothetical protein
VIHLRSDPRGQVCTGSAARPLSAALDVMDDGTGHHIHCLVAGSSRNHRLEGEKAKKREKVREGVMGGGGGGGERIRRMQAPSEEVSAFSPPLSLPPSPSLSLSGRSPILACACVSITRIRVGGARSYGVRLSGGSHRPN